MISLLSRVTVSLVLIHSIGVVQCFDDLYEANVLKYRNEFRNELYMISRLRTPIANTDNSELISKYLDWLATHKPSLSLTWISEEDDVAKFEALLGYMPNLGARVMELGADEAKVLQFGYYAICNPLHRAWQKIPQGQSFDERTKVVIKRADNLVNSLFASAFANPKGRDNRPQRKRVFTVETFGKCFAVLLIAICVFSITYMSTVRFGRT